MAVVAILGAGPIGAALAHRLAERATFREVRLIDEASAIAAGKALDIRQCGPVSGVDVDITSAADPLASAGADVVVLADPIDGHGWEGDRGLVLLRTLTRAGVTAPFVFAGPKQGPLLETAYRELKIPAHRLVGSAAAALVTSMRALAGAEMQLAGTDVSLSLVGRPPALVPAWSSATVAGALVTDRVPAHRLAALAHALPRMWPPGPEAIAAVTAGLASGLARGSARLQHGLIVLDGELGARGVAALLPLELAPGRVVRHVLPSLSPQERTSLMNAVARA